MMNDDEYIGKSWTIPVPDHVGHTLTVRGRDEVAKHKAFWIDCSCGDCFLVGEHWLPAYVANQETPYTEIDRNHRPHRLVRKVVKA